MCSYYAECNMHLSVGLENYVEEICHARIGGPTLGSKFLANRMLP